jgi:hypothetical protein
MGPMQQQARDPFWGTPIRLLPAKLPAVILEELVDD